MLEALDVVDIWKEYLEECPELIPRLGQDLVHHNLQQVCKIVAPVEADPVHAFV